VALFLLVVASSAAAEYCKTQGSPAVPKSQTPGFDEQVFLTQPEIIASETKHLPWGRPGCPHLLFHREYVLCYDVPRKVSGWASYRLEAADVVEAMRMNAFRSDPRLPIDQNPSCDAYSGSGFDRGHLVPRSDMNRTHGPREHILPDEHVAAAAEREPGHVGAPRGPRPGVGQAL
jgi:DNA/RNA endonuclease G (NUC1)